MLDSVDYTSLKALLVNSPYTVVLGYTSLCGTCERAKRMLMVVSESLKDVKFVQINLNLAAKLIADYQIQSVPCFLVFKQEQLVDQFYAFHSVPYLFERIFLQTKEKS